MRFSDLHERTPSPMDTEKRIQQFSKINISYLGAKSVHENNCFCEHIIKLGREAIIVHYGLRCRAALNLYLLLLFTGRKLPIIFLTHET